MMIRYVRAFQVSCRHVGEMKVLGNIQSLRAIAAWSVVYYHYAHHFYDLKPVSILLKTVSFYGNFGVDLFFVISGLIMFYSASQRPVTAPDFISRRLVRIVPAYWFYTVLLLAMLIGPLEFLRLDIPFTWQTVAQSFAFISDDSDPTGAKAPLLYVGWTLTFEMIFYCIFATGLLVPSGHRLFLVFSAVLLVAALWPASWPAGRILGDYRMFEFATGMASGAIWLHFQGKIKYPNPVAAMLLCTAAAMLLFLTGPYYKIGRIMAATLIVLAALFDQIFSSMQFSKWLQRLGDYSYSTYLVHPIVIMLLNKHLGNQFSRLQEWLVILIMTLLVYFISIISWKRVENGLPRLALESLMKSGKAAWAKMRRRPAEA